MQYEVIITAAVLVLILASFEINSLVRLGDSYQPPSLPDRPALIKSILAAVLFSITLALSGFANHYPQGFKYERDRNEAGEYIDLWKSPARTLRGKAATVRITRHWRELTELRQVKLRRR